MRRPPAQISVRLLLSLLLVVAGACSVAPRQEPRPAPSPVYPEVTRGAIDPNVTQENIQQTICVSGYTSRVRPSTSYTNRIKKQLMEEAGIDPSRAKEFELDHIIPLAVGGEPRTLENLQLQAWEGTDGAKRKDRIEVKLQCLVCVGQVLLVVAPREIADDWQTAYHHYAKVKCKRPRQRPVPED